MYQDPLVLQLLEAIRAGNAVEVERLARLGVDVNLGDPSHFGHTPLMVAARSGKADIVTILLTNCKDIALDITEQGGWTALMLASCFGHLSAAEPLVSAGANLNIANEDGWTALTLASSNGHKSVVQLLLEARADTEIRDKFNLRAVDWASERAHTDIVEILNKYSPAAPVPVAGAANSAAAATALPPQAFADSKMPMMGGEGAAAAAGGPKPAAQIDEERKILYDEKQRLDMLLSTGKMSIEVYEKHNRINMLRQRLLDPSLSAERRENMMMRLDDLLME
eukprot:m.163477 g.163477  ORF g.163477 m.163477 type:complete len:281 (-) comp17111_c0_seq1:824-1666(-)